ncbi:MAG TPA: amidohydrolase family protein [Steroidobacteraceae bacterium]|nr:amidohydrolase family protein [Steroidobacteraceae bacterium]
MPPEPVDLIIEPRWLLPVAPANIVLAEHAVAIAAGKIVALGSAERIRRDFEPRERLVREHHALLPGLVNAHTRAATRLLRGLAVQGPLLRWRFEIVLPAEQRWSGPDFARDGVKLAVAEMLRAGITAFADPSLYPEETARVAATTRMRVAVGLPIADEPSAWADSATAYLARAERLWDEYQSDPWVSPYFAPQGADIRDETLVRIRRVADELDARVAMQIHESIVEVRDSLSQHGHRPLRRLRDLGLLRPGFTAVHMNSLEAEDLQAVGASGICAVACPQSDLRLGSGICPARQLAAQDIAVGLGTGDPVAVGALDLLAEARTAALACGALPEAGRLSAEDVLYMATLGSATAVGLSAQVGSIEPGKSADLLCLDLNVAGCEPVLRAADAIVFGATRSQVSDVWLSGRAAVSAGKLLAFDEQELAALERQWRQRMRRGSDQ